jgi:hypothetical protein
MRFLLLLSMMLVLQSCTSFLGYGPEFDKTDNLIRQVDRLCAKNLNNDLLQKSECLPLLNQKPILIKAKLVRDENGILSVVGSPNPWSFYVECQIKPEQAHALRRDPSALQIDSVYQVSGNAVKYSQDVKRSTTFLYDSDTGLDDIPMPVTKVSVTFLLANCTISPHVKS